MPRNRIPPPPGPGRPKGLQNKATREIREFAQQMLCDPKYQASLKKRLIEGKAPHMETLLHHYGWGKPKERVEHSGDASAPVVFTLNLAEHDRDV